MNTIRHSAFGMVALAAFACANPATDKPRAEVGPAVPTPAAIAPAPVASAVRLALSPENTKLEFVGSKITGSHTGVFERFGGEITAPSSDPSAAAVRVSIEMDSVKTDSEKLDEHLRSPDFFEVDEFPTATFESTTVVPADRSKARFTITGNLTLHGVTKSVSFPATISLTGGKVTARAEFSINRKDFGIVYPGMPDDLIRDEVVIRIVIDAPLPS